jgi:hypothetical protein
MPMVSLTATSKTPRSAIRWRRRRRARRDRHLVRAPERGREVSAHAQPRRERAIAHALVGRERIVDALIDVLAAEGVGRGGEDCDFRDAGGDRAIEAGMLGTSAV